MSPAPAKREWWIYSENGYTDHVAWDKPQHKDAWKYIHVVPASDLETLKRERDLLEKEVVFQKNCAQSKADWVVALEAENAALLADNKRMHTALLNDGRFDEDMDRISALEAGLRETKAALERGSYALDCSFEYNGYDNECDKAIDVIDALLSGAEGRYE